MWSRFPANEQISGSSKIPTVIYYDKEGNVRAVGAEAVREGIHEIASDEGWVKAEWCVVIHPFLV
jgi:stage V sporulation protein SpoVS